MRTTTEISNSQNVIDSRDIIARIEYLESMEEDEDFDEDGKEELTLLRKVKEEGEGISDWTSGVSLINEDYFEDYAQEFAEDIGAIDKSYNWPANCIDWERAARELQMDYTPIDFDGVTFYAR